VGILILFIGYSIPNQVSDLINNYKKLNDS